MLQTREHHVTIVAVTGPAAIFELLQQAADRVASELLPAGFEAEDYFYSECEDMGMKWSYYGFGIAYLFSQVDGEPKACIHRGVAEVAEYRGPLHDIDAFSTFILANACPKFGSFHEVNRLLYFR